MTLVEQLRYAAQHTSTNNPPPILPRQSLYSLAADRIEELEAKTSRSEYSYNQLHNDVMNVTGLDECIVFEMGIIELLSYAAQHIFLHEKTGPDVDRIRQATKDIYSNGKLMATELSP